MRKEVIIGNTKYRIRKVGIIEKDPNVLGKIKHDTRDIYIKKDKRKEEIDTLYHEIAHGLMVDFAFAGSENGLKMRDLSAMFRLNNNEGFIEHFGTTLKKMFKLR